MRRVLVTCGRRSESATALVAALNAAGVTAVRKLNLARQPGANSLVVNWGTIVLPPWEANGAKVLNLVLAVNKWEELKTLFAGGIPTIPFIKPWDTYAGGVAFSTDVWLPRSLHHHGASDLRRLRAGRAFLTRRLTFTKEFRVHVFEGKSIRVGRKAPRPGATVHPWIRSYATGWDILYDTAAVQGMRSGWREIAKRAVAALDYDFGAVDLAIEAETNRAVVLEVNSAPGLDTPATAQAYARHIAAVARGD